MAEHGVQRLEGLHTNVSALAQAGDGVTSHSMPGDIWDAQLAAASGLISGMFDAGDLSADCADAYLFYISDVAKWSEIGETAYFLGRKQVLAQ